MKRTIGMGLAVLVALGATAWMLMHPPGAAYPGNQPVAAQDQGVLVQGMLTATPQLIDLRPPRSGLVKAVTARVGDHVKAGQLLVQLDDTDLQAQRRVLQGELNAAQVRLADQQKLAAYYEKLFSKGDGRFLSEMRYTEARNGVREAQAEVRRIEMALQALDIDMTQRQLRAPLDGTLVHFVVQPGMWLQASEYPADEMVLAPDGPLLMAVELPQQLLRYFSPTAPAQARLIGQRQTEVTLVFDHLEPWAHPPHLSTLISTARNDLPVVTLYYRLKDPALLKPAYVGMRFNVSLTLRW